ncbi:MAG: DUF3352 domain-containing protein [Planctomycetaceae bacterium]|jgi:hypothetical protein|nr:DUF3352 domain-containing protein [Planctomycetaceae bacterium]
MFRFVLFVSTALFCTSLHAASPSADQIFPDTTKGFLSIRNLKDFGDQWKHTQFGQLLDDPLMENFNKEIRKQMTERMEKTFGLTLDGISSLPSGEVAFGMIAVPNQVPGYVLTMDVAGKSAETDTYLTNLTKKLVAVGVKKGTETYKGQQITSLVFPPSVFQPPKSSPATLGNTRIVLPPPVERRAYFMFFRDILIASDQLHLLKLIADRVADQSGKSLAGVEGYQVVMKRCISDMPAGIQPIIRWYVEPLDYGESVRVLLRGSAAQNRRNRPSVFSILKQQGFDALRGIGGVVSITTEEQETVYRTFVYAKKPFRLAMRMFNLPDQTDFAPPAWMPSDLARCTMIHVDPNAIFDNLGVLFDAFVMPGEVGVWQDILDGLEKDPHGPRINLRKELIDHLNGRVMSMSQYEQPITTTSESIVVAVELKAGREPAILASMDKLYGTDPEMQCTPYKSYKIWHRKPMDTGIRTARMGDVDIPDILQVSGLTSVSNTASVKTAAAQAADDDYLPTFPNGGIVAANNFLFLSTNRNYLKIVLDRLDAPAEAAKSTIGNEAEYHEVDKTFAGMGLTSKPRFFQFFVFSTETLRPPYELIRNGQIAQSEAVAVKLLNMLFFPEEESGTRQHIIDGSTMPEFDLIQHYFGKAGMYGVSEENGFFFKGFTLKR